MSGMLRSRTRATTFRAETSGTVGNWAGAMVIALLVLLVQASDDRRGTARSASDAVIPEPKHPEPPSTKDEAPVAEAPVVTPRPPVAARKPRTSPPEQTREAPAESPQPTPKPAPSPVEPTEESAKWATAALDLASLEQRLRDTRAIGVFTKLSLKNQVDDLLGEFREFHQSGDQTRLAKLRETFDLLILKVLSLLQDRDPALAREVSSSREALWNILIDPDTFKTL